MSLAPTIAIVGFSILGLSICGAIYAALAAMMLCTFRRRTARAEHRVTSLTILRPLSGDEPELYQNLASVCEQRYGGAVQMVLGVARAADPALAIANRLGSDWPTHDISAQSNPTLHGGNRKISNLINMAHDIRGDIVVIADSDVRFPPDAFEAIVAGLEEPGVGLVYCLYRGRPAGNIWSRLAAMDINTRFAPSVVVGQALGAHPCLGPTMALRAELLKQIGGLERLADFLADDYELGRAVREAGYRVTCAPLVIDHVFPERTLGEMFAHELRWARTIRLVQPAGYFGSAITHFVVLGLIGSALTGFSLGSLELLGGLVLFRHIQAKVVSGLMGAHRDPIWLVLPRDLLSFAVFLAAGVGNRIEWRGAKASIARDGRMSAR